MGEARGEKPFYSRKQQSGRAMRACMADSACGAGGARPFSLEAGKAKTRTFCKRMTVKIRKNIEMNRRNVLKYSLSRLKRGGTKEEEKGMKTVFEKVFQLSKHKTTAKTEVMAGITTFMTMAYILAVNPSVLSAAGWTLPPCCWRRRCPPLSARPAWR